MKDEDAERASSLGGGVGGGKEEGGGVPRTASESSVFSNLEAIRTNLEDQLGLDTMLHAYHVVQVCRDHVYHVMWIYIICQLVSSTDEKLPTFMFITPSDYFTSFAGLLD